jgi:AraC-like DNA-binding protein
MLDSHCTDVCLQHVANVANEFLTPEERRPRPSHRELAGMALLQAFPNLKNSSQDVQQIAQLVDFTVDFGLPLVCFTLAKHAFFRHQRQCHPANTAMAQALIHPEKITTDESACIWITPS